jgi:hypothetical protein
MIGLSRPYFLITCRRELEAMRSMQNGNDGVRDMNGAWRTSNGLAAYIAL